jgi:O-antigen/teichoic acid export membrane protein
MWHVRHGEFGRLARTRVAQSGGSAAMQITTGLAGVGTLGLLLGQVLNTGIACVALARPVWRATRQCRWAELRRLAHEQRRFPLYSTAEALANSAAVYLPVIMIAGHAGAREAGHLAMAMFVAQAPMSLIGNSISQAFLSRAALEQREGKLGEFTGEVLSGLIKSGTGPLLALGILSPVICGWVFGAGWTRTGWLVSWMSPWFLMQFLAVPVSTALHICGRQRAALILQLAGLALRLGSLVVMSRLGIAGITEAYAITGFLFYGLYLAVIVSATGTDPRRLWQALVRSRNLLLAWVAGSVSLAVIAVAVLGATSP